LTSVAEPLHPGYTREDSEAARLYAEHADRILAYCRRHLSSGSEAEDAVQTTFLYALRALRSGVVPECESAWLHTIARNVCRWQHRTASRHPTSGSVEVEHLPCPDPDDAREVLAELNDALESLPERQRHALVLREWRGLSANEIADHLELSAPATHALLTRARHALAQALTAPRRAALGLAAAAYEVRSWLKAALGGASAKAAVATVAVVGAGAGAVATERSFAEREPASAQLSSSVPRTGELEAHRTAPSGVAARGTAGVERTQRIRKGRAKTGGSTRDSATVVTAHDRVRVISLPRRGGDRVPGAAPPTDAPAPSSPLPAVPPAPSLDVPKPAVAELPTVHVPPLDPPSVDVPPVDLPTDLLPTVDVPPVDLPPVDVPPVDPSQLPPLPKLP
jgi:RNA polymerase sigma factor (sigma-70 family)